MSGASLPANATAWTGDVEYIGSDVDYTYWDIDEQGSISHSGIVHDLDADESFDASEDLDADGVLDAGEDLDSDGILDTASDHEFDRVWCGTSGGLELDGDYVSVVGLDRVVDANGDIVITGTGTFGSLDAALEYRAYAEGDLLRTTYVVTNNTNSAITVTPSTYDDTSDASGSGTTSSGDEILNSEDLWWTQYDAAFSGGNVLSGDSPSVVFGRYYGSAGKIEIDASSFDPFNGDDDDVLFNDVTIQPGASYQWIFFYQMLGYDQSAGDGVATAAAALAVSDSAADEFGGATPELSDRLARGLNANIDSNWVINTELAETGIDASGIALAGAALAAAGVAVVARRRRASN